MNAKQLLIFFLILFSNYHAVSQSKLNKILKPSDTLNVSRRNTAVITESVIGGLSLLGLQQLWYNDFEQSKFHTINDSKDWLQMDKLGHFYSAYQIGKYGAQVLNWSGLNEKHQLMYGATLGFTFLTIVEVFDGFSKEWGFSWSDMAANSAGLGLYVGQELLWKEQRLQLKYSFHQTRFSAQRPNVLGNTFLETVLKDYNGQTYWISANMQSFFSNTKLPKWLNIAFGYGVNGLLTGGKEGSVAFQNQNRQRRFYLSLDIDFTRIKTQSYVLKTLFSLFNSIKVPFPTVEFIGKNDIKFHAIYF